MSPILKCVRRLTVVQVTSPQEGEWFKFPGGAFASF